jgi:hypothetical protein
MKAEDRKQGLCLRFPPSAVHDEATGVWPVVLSSQWCGEFKAK